MEYTSARRNIRIIMILAIAAFACLFLCSCDPVLSLNPKYSYSSFELELGEEVSPDISEYVDMSVLSPEEASFVRANSEILYDGEPAEGTCFNGAGDHTLTIMYNGRRYRQYNILVTDTEPPVITATGNLYTFEGMPIDESQIDSLFTASDNSGDVKVSIERPDVDYDTEGDYKIRATATDPSGNSSEALASIVVQKPEYGAMGTYIFVSIDDQHLTYFVDGKAVMDCPVVTGNVAAGHSTPRGSYRILYMSRNMTLKGRENNGDEYESFVSYWMAFIGSAYGLHDATWRSNFGGTIYQTRGSHGCVNMPPRSAAELYGMITPGTLIFIY